MNPNDGTFHPLTGKLDPDLRKAVLEDFSEALQRSQLVLPNGEPVPDNWLHFTVGERLVIKDHTFEVKWIGKDAILLQPVPLEIDGT